MPLETNPHIKANKIVVPSIPDNPSQEGWDKMSHEDGPFFLCHHNIAELKPNDVISAKELGPGAQLSRLLRLGAITVASPEHEEAYKAYLKGLPPTTAEDRAKEATDKAADKSADKSADQGKTPAKDDEANKGDNVAKSFQPGGFGQPPKGK